MSLDDDNLDEDTGFSKDPDEIHREARRERRRHHKGEGSAKVEGIPDRMEVARAKDALAHKQLDWLVEWRDLVWEAASYELKGQKALAYVVEHIDPLNPRREHSQRTLDREVVRATRTYKRPNAEAARDAVSAQLQMVMGGIRKQIVGMDQAVANNQMIDIELYCLLVDKWVKVSERYCKLLGLDLGGNNGRVAAPAPGQPDSSIDIEHAADGSTSIHIKPGSSIHTDRELQQIRQAQEAIDVAAAKKATGIMEMHEVGGVYVPDNAGITLAPDVDARVLAEKEPPKNATAALKMF